MQPTIPSVSPRCSNMLPILPTSSRCRALTLVELLVTVSIVAVLAGVLLPVAGKIRDRGDLARDVGHLRQYSTAYQLFAGEATTISADDILLWSDNISRYATGVTNTRRLMSSASWVRLTKDFAASQGKTINERTRSYTLNQNLFPPKPGGQGWEIDPAPAATLRANPNKPMLYTGVYLAGHDGAYIWGGRSHANPVYSGIRKTDPSNTIQGQSAVLFLGGHVRLVDFRTENMPASGAGSDPEGWWKSLYQ